MFINVIQAEIIGYFRKLAQIKHLYFVDYIITLKLLKRISMNGDYLPMDNNQWVLFCIFFLTYTSNWIAYHTSRTHL